MSSGQEKHTVEHKLLPVPLVPSTHARDPSTFVEPKCADSPAGWTGAAGLESRADSRRKAHSLMSSIRGHGGNFMFFGQVKI